MGICRFCGGELHAWDSNGSDRHSQERTCNAVKARRVDALQAEIDSVKTCLQAAEERAALLQDIVLKFKDYVHCTDDERWDKWEIAFNAVYDFEPEAVQEQMQEGGV